MTLDIEAIREGAVRATYFGGLEQEQADTILALIAEVERLQAQIDRAKELHSYSHTAFDLSEGTVEKCNECSWIHPCPTFKALGVEK